MMGERLKKYLREEGYKFLDLGGNNKDLGQHLSRCRNNYQGNQGQQQSQSNYDQNQHSGNTNQTTPNTPIIQPIIIEQKSGFDFWDIMLLSCLWGRGGNTTNIYTSNVPNTNSRSNESDDRVLGPCIAAFCLIFATVASYFLLAYAAHKIKNAKLENNKYSVPSAIGLGVFSFSVSATLVLLLSGMIVPNLERAMGISSGAFTGFQVITGLNAVIFGLGAVLFFYLAIDKASKKALVDREVDRMINCNMCSPGYGTAGNQSGGQQFSQHEQYKNRSFSPSAPPQQPPSYAQAVGGDQYYNQPGTSEYNNPYQSPQSYLNNSNLSCDQASSLPPKY